MRAIRLINNLPPGDALVMSAAVHSLHATHPGRFRTAVQTLHPDLWLHNPDVVAADGDFEDVQTHYPLFFQCRNRPVHFLDGYCQFLAHALQVPVPCVVNHPLLYLSDEERGWTGQVEEKLGRRQKYWVVCAGVKTDFTLKQWPWYQQAIDQLQGRVFFVQVGKLTDQHRPLRGALNLLGQTDLRQLIRLVYHAEGVLCGTTFLMHLAAALKKPAVIVAGAREPRFWNTYPRQVLLSNVGTLTCCAETACLRDRVIRLGDGADNDNNLCDQPVQTDPPSGRCMALITPEDVCRSVLSYYEGGVLSA